MASCIKTKILYLIMELGIGPSTHVIIHGYSPCQTICVLKTTTRQGGIGCSKGESTMSTMKCAEPIKWAVDVHKVCPMGVAGSNEIQQ